MAAEDAPDPPHESRFTIRARIVAIWGLGAAVAALVGLVIALVTHGGDQLSTIALILAIVAFALQIVFFMLQVWVASEQNRRGQALASEASSVLAHIDVKLDATVEVINKQFRFVLERVFAERAASPGLGDGDLPSDDELGGADDVHAPPEQPEPLAMLDHKIEKLTRMVRAVNHRRGVLEEWDDIARSHPQSGSDDEGGARPDFAAAKEVLTSWPEEEEGRPVAEKVHALPPEAVCELRRMSQMSLRNTEVGTMPPAVFSTRAGQAVVDALVTSGLAYNELRTADPGRGPALRLTPQGNTALRLFQARGFVPDWNRPFIEEQRDEADFEEE